MTSKSPWRTEIVRRYIDEEIDWVDCNPGPEMRGILGRWFKPGISGPDTTVWLQVKHLSDGRAVRVPISKDGRRYKAKYGGEYLTLEAATKKMKEELRPGR